MSTPTTPPTPDAARSIHFDIGRITLHGYSARERDCFENALRAHLAELAASQQGAFPASGNRHIERLDAGTIPAGASPDRAARLIASRVIGAVARSASATNPTGSTGTASTSSTASPGGAAHA
jgi:hypothetical protein